MSENSESLNNMDHLTHLSEVAQSDIEMLQHKEQTYRGSWKRAGGRSAWFMLRRNMDRLIEIMRKPVTPEVFNLQNVDDTIEAITLGISHPGMPDVTAAMFKYLRDCYVSENVFAKIRENPSGADGTMLACLRDLRRYCMLVEAEMVARGVVRPEYPPVRPAPQPDFMPDKPRSTLRDRLMAQKPRTSGPGTPEDGGHHEPNVSGPEEYLATGFDADGRAEG